MQKSTMFMAVALFIACCGAAPASNGNNANSNNANSNNGRPTQARITALDIAAARKNHYIDPFTLREVASDSMFRKVIAERMKNKIKPPKFHKPPRSPNKPDEDEGDHDHGPGNDDHDHGPHDDHDNGNHNGQGNTNGNSGQGNDKDKKDDKKESRTPERRFR